jgi:hypothetical protein
MDPTALCRPGGSNPNEGKRIVISQNLQRRAQIEILPSKLEDRKVVKQRYLGSTGPYDVFHIRPTDAMPSYRNVALEPHQADSL